MKTCIKCKIEKDLTNFYNDGHSKDCRDCRKAYYAKYRKDNKEKIKAYYANNKEALKAYAVVYRRTPEGKAVTKRNISKHPNAKKSRKYYNDNKHKITTIDSCERCGDVSKRIEAHHCDYNKPMEVIYLCQYCHCAWHKAKTPLNRVSGIFTDK